MEENKKTEGRFGTTPIDRNNPIKQAVGALRAASEAMRATSDTIVTHEFLGSMDEVADLLEGLFGPTEEHTWGSETLYKENFELWKERETYWGVRGLASLILRINPSTELNLFTISTAIRGTLMRLDAQLCADYDLDKRLKRYNKEDRK